MLVRVGRQRRQRFDLADHGKPAREVGRVARMPAIDRDRHLRLDHQQHWREGLHDRKAHAVARDSMLQRRDLLRRQPPGHQGLVQRDKAPRGERLAFDAGEPVPGAGPDRRWRRSTRGGARRVPARWKQQRLQQRASPSNSRSTSGTSMGKRRDDKRVLELTGERSREPNVASGSSTLPAPPAVHQAGHLPQGPRHAPRRAVRGRSVFTGSSGAIAPAR